MRHHSRHLVAATATTLLALGLPVSAQETPAPPPAEPPPAETKTEESVAAEETTRPVQILLEVAAWQAEPYGPDFVPAYTSPPGEPGTIVSTRVPQDGVQRWRYRAGVRATDPKWGGVDFVYWSQEGTDHLKQLTLGTFGFYEALPISTFSGFQNDGLADGFEASLRQSVRDLRLLYTHVGLDGPRFDAEWHVGFRRVEYGRTQEATYYAILPPFLPPLISTQDQPGLQPVPDEAESASSFDGRGLDFGVDARLMIFKNFHVAAGVTVAALRGNTDASYESSTSLYLKSDGTVLNGDEYQVFFQDNPDGDSLTQAISTLRIEDRSSTAAFAWEAYLEARWRFWRTAEVFVGGRAVRYDDVVTILRPEIGFTFSASRESVGFEGVYLGLAYTF